MADAFVERKQANISSLEIIGDEAGNVALKNPINYGDIQFELTSTGLLTITGIDSLDYLANLSSGNNIPNKAYVDSRIPVAPASGVPYNGASEALNMGAWPVTSHYVPIADIDLANKKYVDRSGGLGSGAVSGSVNLKTLAATDFYTVPTGYDLLITEIETYCQAVTGSGTTYPSIKFGTSLSNSLFWEASSIMVGAAGSCHIIRSTQPAQPAGTIIRATITSASDWTTQTGCFIIRGTLIPNPLS